MDRTIDFMDNLTDISGGLKSTANSMSNQLRPTGTLKRPERNGRKHKASQNMNQPLEIQAATPNVQSKSFEEYNLNL